MASILTGAALVTAAVLVAWWIISGSGLDGRHLSGYLGWMLLAAMLTGQTAVRLGEYVAAHDRVRDREAEVERAAVHAAQEAVERRAAATGTWTGDGPGQRLTVRQDDAGHLVVQGWLSDHWQQHEERIWSRGTDGLAEIVRELERSGELAPVDDPGTVFVRALLDLGAWPLPSFGDIERDWSRRDGDTVVVGRTA